jgi:hypothetical protein
MIYPTSSAYSLIQPRFGTHEAGKQKTHIHGPHCHHEHVVHSSNLQQADKTRTPFEKAVTSFGTKLQNAFQTILRWMKEFLMGLYTDIKLLIQGPQKTTPHVHGPHCNHGHSHDQQA